MAAKRRWQSWRTERHGLTKDKARAIQPNIVISSTCQAVWEKLFRHFDVTPALVHPNLLNDKMAADLKRLAPSCNEKTIAVVATLGNHCNGMHDPVWKINTEVQKLSEASGWQIGAHVDAASGGFVTPFQVPCPPPFDFHLPTALSISSSGHKFGESICGTGWLAFRERRNLAEHVGVSASCLGGQSDSMTLNFSCPASGACVQCYKLLRLGREGFCSKIANQMSNAMHIRSFLKRLARPGASKPRFVTLDGSDSCSLPVVAAWLNPDIQLPHNDVDPQRALSAT